MANPLANMPPPTPEFLAESTAPQILIGSILPAAFATVFVLARFWSRAIITKNWGWDDSWILFSWLGGGVLLTVLNCYLTKLGAGKHMITIPMGNALDLVRTGLTCRLVYQVVILTTKYGMCAFYLRIFTDRTSKRFIWGMVAFNTLYSVPLMFALIFRCNPIAANWSLIPGKCRSDIPPLYASTVLNIVGDAALICFAIPKITPLQISRRQKASLIVIMSLSILIIIAAILRCYYVRLIAKSFDVSFAPNVVIWTAVEVNTALFCTSAPALKPLIKKVSFGWLSTGGGTGREPNLNKLRTGSTGTEIVSLELSSRTNLKAKEEQREHLTGGRAGNSSTSNGASDPDALGPESGVMREIRNAVEGTVEGNVKEEIDESPRKFETV